VVSVAAQQLSVAQQRSAVEQQRSQVSHNAEQAYALGNAALVGTGVGLAASAALFPLLLPLVLLTGGVAAGAAAKHGNSTSRSAAEFSLRSQTLTARTYGRSQAPPDHPGRTRCACTAAPR
jgi:hypothetical protein